MYKQRRPDVRLDTSLESLLERTPRDASPRVLATVVTTAGSTYRKPGARMLIMADGSCYGLLSGGCLEADLALHARGVLESGIPRAIEYDMRGPDDVLFGIGAGCEGAMRVLLEPAGVGSLAALALAEAGRTTGSGRATSLVAVHESADLGLGTYADSAVLPPELTRACAATIAASSSREVAFESGGRRTRAFAQFLAPPPHLLICGAGPDAEPVVSAAVALGWRVSVVDHRPAYAVAVRFPGAAVVCAAARTLRSSVDVDRCHAAVVMSHHLPSDVTYLRELSEAGVPGYVGLLGPAARRRRIAEELGEAGDGLAARLRGPVGFDIGAVTPEGIALSIVSQIHSWLADRRGEDARLQNGIVPEPMNARGAPGTAYPAYPAQAAQAAYPAQAADPRPLRSAIASARADKNER
ncbi:MAG: xanthine dehydrogenase accessory factor [Gammaproteobacteria bacterium]|jgi:xanthine/CO dehydrogenase XdhC/CoxF family maturation factor|nr:xanthine dehydrogenase accessory factor [Gammaproteobacteria bacterium]